MNEINITDAMQQMSPAELGGEIRLLSAQMARVTLDYGCEIGHRLTVAKEKVPHGEWLNWLEVETGLSRATASRFMKIYEEYGSRQESLFGVSANVATLQHLSVSKALRLLAVPEEEREEFAAEVDAEHISTRELERAIRERDEAKARSEELMEELKTTAEEAEKNEAIIDGLQQALQNEQDKVKELESRPVEVAVQEDKEAIRKAAEAARKAAEKKTAGEIAGLKEKLRLAEQQAKANASEIGRSEERIWAEAKKAEEARKEAEELRKQIAAAESGAGEVKIYCRNAQEAFFAALDKITEIHTEKPDAAGKMLEGLTAIVEGLGEEIRIVKEKWTV